jgi:hypothetical protein
LRHRADLPFDTEHRGSGFERPSCEQPLFFGSERNRLAVNHDRTEDWTNHLLKRPSHVVVATVVSAAGDVRGVVGKRDPFAPGDVMSLRVFKNQVALSQVFRYPRWDGVFTAAPAYGLAAPDAFPRQGAYLIT